MNYELTWRPNLSMNNMRAANGPTEATLKK